jgi:hypothetical protein
VETEKVSAKTENDAEQGELAVDPGSDAGETARNTDGEAQGPFGAHSSSVGPGNAPIVDDRKS